MKMLRGKDGFSLIELLTVIAIIAILAGIIFPVMNIVKNRAKVVQCQTNLHDIAMGLKMFKEDNRRYPQTIAGYVQYDKDNNVLPLDQTRATAATGDGLYPEYTKSTKTFHCSLSPTTGQDKVVNITVDGIALQYYAYDSYDIYSAGIGDQTIAETDAPNYVRYAYAWARSTTPLGPGYELPPYPQGATDNDNLRQYDYKRQLKFKYTSDDTVVTWCSYHERTGDPKAMVPVLFLDGHSDLMPAPDVNTCKWRVHPKAG